jgi:predicted AAA+ superfamily ATPase
MLKRTIDQDLLTWKDVKERRPLVLRGARQVGKSFTIREFARQHFSDFVEINFEKQPELKALFNGTDVKKILKGLSQWSNQEIIQGKSLLFIDEIQECPQALLALRYFFEELPQLHVVAAGSLLDFLLREQTETLRIPVGRIEYRYLHPLSFKEFLLATQQTGVLAAIADMKVGAPLLPIMHEKALQQVEIYLRVGGMPAVVSAYQQAPESFRYREIQAAITQTYREDFLKYQSRVDRDIIEAVFRKLPLFATKKFKYVDLASDTQSRTIKAVLELFDRARVISKVFTTAANGLPFNAESNTDRFKFILIDCGLMAQMQQIPVSVQQGFNLDLVNSGALAEQFVGQELLQLLHSYDEPRLYYWHRESKSSQAEVDYVLADRGEVVPVEVKAGKTGRLKSLRIFIETKRSRVGVRISQHEVSLVDEILSVPFYAVSEISRLCLDC